ncbi:MAG: hypothetical protein ABSH50_04885 [Bryobacteraceae bacterium]|jgi:hypothetical protein
MTARLMATLLLVAGAAFSGDAEFEHIVKAIEAHYGTAPQHIPFMGLASFVVKVAHPEGASGLKLAVFQDLKSSEGRDWAERDRFMGSLSSTGLHPMVRVHSRRNGEATYIFLSPESKRARILIATFERDEATVIEVKADVDRLLRTLDQPEHHEDR